MLERVATIQLKTVLQEGRPRIHRAGPLWQLRVFPERREELFEYDVVLFGDVRPGVSQRLSDGEPLRVRRAKRAAWCSSPAPAYMPLGIPRVRRWPDLMPIDFHAGGGPDPGQVVNEPYQVEPTDLGMAGPTMQLGDSPADSAEIWHKLPPLYWY